jgi:hypothetical protein
MLFQLSDGHFIPSFVIRMQSTDSDVEVEQAPPQSSRTALIDVQDHEFEELKQYMSSNDRRNNRNNQTRDFMEMLERIRRYVEQGDKYDTNRRARVGICWLSDAIAVNIGTLKQLTGKSKSSLNGALKEVGYTKVNFPACSALVSELERKIPNLALHHLERQKWSIRRAPPVGDLAIPLIESGDYFGSMIWADELDPRSGDDDPDL